MGEIHLRCRQCNWAMTIDQERIPRYGARIRCPECNRLQLLAPVPAGGQSDLDDLLARKAAPPTQPKVELNAPITESELLRSAPAPVRGEARQVLALWLQELQGGHTTPLTEAILFSDYGEELAQLFSVWGASYPGERAAEVFRVQLREALERLDPGPGPRSTASPTAQA